MNKPLSEEKIQEIVEATQESYSLQRYGIRAWVTSIQNLWELGYTQKQIVDLMRSKLPRHAADSFSKSMYNCEFCDGSEVIKYHNKHGKQYLLKNYL